MQYFSIGENEHNLNEIRNIFIFIVFSLVYSTLNSNFDLINAN